MSEVTGAPAEGAVTPTAPETAAAPASDPIADRVNELAGSVGSLVEGFQAFQQRFPAPEPEETPDPWAALTGQVDQPQEFFDAFGNPVELPQQQPGLDVNALRQAYQADLQNALTPYQAEMAQIRAERAAEQLGQMIPALADTPENQANRQQAAQLVTNALQNYPSAIANQLAADPNFIATQWKAAEADRLAAGQAPASEAVPAVEAAGGATPGGSGSEQNIVDRIMGQRHETPPGFR